MTERLTFKLGLKLPGSNEVFQTELFLTHELADKWGQEQRAKFGYNYEIDDLKENPEKFKEYAIRDRKKEYPPVDDMVIAIFKHLNGDSSDFNLIKDKILQVDAKYPTVKVKKP